MANERHGTREDVTPDALLQLAAGFMAAKHLFVATEIDLFGHLAAGPALLADLAVRAGVPWRTARIAADAMVTLGVMERDGDHYRNGPVADQFLTGRGQADLRPVLRFWNRVSYPMWVHLEAAIRTGAAPDRQGGGFSAEDQRSVGAFAAVPAERLASDYDFSRHQRVLDLGGGTGAFLLPVLRRYAGIAGTLFELPGAAAVARPALAREPDGPRIAVIAGDMFADPIPTGHDALLLANVIHVFSPEHNRALFTRVRLAVAPGARLLIADMFTDPTHTNPAFAALLAGEFLLMSGEGDVYSAADVQAWLRETGWEPVTHQPLTGPMSLLVAQAI